MNITSLPDDVFFLIFKYLSLKDLCRLCSVCRRFQHLTSKDSVWIQNIHRLSTVKNLLPFISRSHSAKDLSRIAYNWIHGKYKEGFIIKVNRRFRLLPWLQKTDEGIWFSCRNKICFITSNSSGYYYEEKQRCLLGLPDDATKFTVKNNVVASGCIDGSVCVWDISRGKYFCHRNIHPDEIQCIDFTDDIIISGTRDGTIKSFPFTKSNYSKLPTNSHNVGERIWCLNISPCKSYFAAGLAGWLSDPPILLWDLASSECLGRMNFNHKQGAGVFDLKFESPHELLTCGYDTFLRLWDLRTLKCVIQWEEPFDSALYCLETDSNNSIAVGTAQYGMVRMWDKRKTEPVQAYYSYKSNSPVYSLATDHGHLYLALDSGLNILNFTAHHMPSKLNPSTFMGYQAC
ncbi:F-box/WD repeat-containing protein 4 [Biomphalaria pfeifferi]|uniref:F-box/WD repeat-containing protein 4 n=1 Tax=Biomphalaria pfeifferi TaxID=112525 RepID=A0AAD8BHH1_BIOPF|nr:F-box/WD repeat-containing protein 4 [Biomphalaria pfeifferi]